MRKCTLLCFGEDDHFMSELKEEQLEEFINALNIFIKGAVSDYTTLALRDEETKELLVISRDNFDDCILDEFDRLERFNRL